ncbi:MAG: right-handed parallel beta-helix repeat-containing protein, partial [Clostridia bacterium]|nr:right-handed parallel beta-helix repeat-containing protein [Clostridia bacterium]
MIYHVSPKGSNRNTGCADAPFKTISHAAKLAAAGDTVVVHEGVYREWVDPKNGGLNELSRITYTAAEGEKVVIKGSEIVTDWEKVEGTVWKKTLSNTLFGDYNPYATPIVGDWLTAPMDKSIHVGDVYVNGVSIYESPTEEQVYTDEPLEDRCHLWFEKANYPEVYIPDPQKTLYRWYAKVEEDTTTLLVNFREIDPNRETIEINVRECCFYPTRVGVNYITVRGFEMAHAACNFTPPTSDQRAMLGVNWSKGWIIENNRLHDARCSAVSIGKEASTGHNDYTYFRRKFSHYYQTEAVFRALQGGWDKDKIGSHLVRNNVIYDCGQNGIVGHLGCVFSRIEHNHIYHIARKHEFYGHEVGAIKLHTAIDVVIENNCIHDCYRGTWLDWQAQGARVTGNLYYNNDEDFWIEVTHGPCTVDNNIMLSANNVQNAAQGTAFVHNILAGNVFQYAVMNRQTPYHYPHSTQVLGVAPVHAYDDRILNNLILCSQATNGRYLPIQTCYAEALSCEDYLAGIKKEY